MSYVVVRKQSHPGDIDWFLGDMTYYASIEDAYRIDSIAEARYLAWKAKAYNRHLVNQNPKYPTDEFVVRDVESGFETPAPDYCPLTFLVQRHGGYGLSGCEFWDMVSWHTTLNGAKEIALRLGHQTRILVAILIDNPNDEQWILLKEESPHYQPD